MIIISHVLWDILNNLSENIARLNFPGLSLHLFYINFYLIFPQDCSIVDKQKEKRKPDEAVKMHAMNTNKSKQVNLAWLHNDWFVAKGHSSGTKSLIINRRVIRGTGKLY